MPFSISLHNELSFGLALSPGTCHGGRQGLTDAPTSCKSLPLPEPQGANWIIMWCSRFWLLPVQRRGESNLESTPQPAS